MQLLLKLSICLLVIFASTQETYAQVACCTKESKASADCDPSKKTTKACCAIAPKNSTSGCTPSNCRGAKTKFGEAKIISDLRVELISLKAKIEDHDKLKFSNSSITVHGIVGESDDESLEIIADHVVRIESEMTSLTDHELKAPELSKNKAIQVKQLKERISTLSNIL